MIFNQQRGTAIENGEGMLDKEATSHALGLNYKELQDKFNRGELEHKMAQGLSYIDPKTGSPWYDEDNKVF